MGDFHVPVLLEEVAYYLNCRSEGIYVDGTVGGGGHAHKILEMSAPNGRLIGIDLDEDALKTAERNLKKFGDRVTLIRGNFADVEDILGRLNIFRVDGVLLDLGPSLHQLTSPERGFGFSVDGPLDMRMDRRSRLTAKTIVNRFGIEELEEIIWRYGEERMAAEIAQAIVKKRETSPIETTKELKELIMSVLRTGAKRSINPATKTFQALRIAVNRELENLKKAIPAWIEALNPSGRMVIISYHSLEDRIVKEVFTFYSKDCVCAPRIPHCICGHSRKIRLITRKPVRPTDEEVQRNRRARSAKLRASERV
ncbi:MAG: 16S rRNA (cytosine(1402)-N(4))-methyltransferase RsmH [Syntrophales bacterium]|nr:16S rRNA (cytosine(1402)-N(4))-methyltransferase RsmH [Syntrophales bacterium]